MRYVVRLSDRAHRDLDQILAWFYDNNALAAGRQWERNFRSALRKLARQPFMCAFAIESETLGVPVRELHIGKRPGVYRILFTISDNEIAILHIRHSARDEISLRDLS